MANGHYLSDHNMNSFVIRTIKNQEINTFWDLYADILSTEFPGYSKNIVQFFLEKLYTRASYAYWIAHSMKIILLAFVDEKPVGFAVIDEPYGGVSFCRWLGIQKDFQRKGIGSKLIETWIEIAKKSGCHKVELAAQPEARAFYKKIGLIEEGTREKSYFGIDQYVFGKVIGIPDEEIMTNSI